MVSAVDDALSMGGPSFRHAEQILSCSDNAKSIL
jgi:hypothetical protein